MEIITNDKVLINETEIIVNKEKYIIKEEENGIKISKNSYESIIIKPLTARSIKIMTVKKGGEDVNKEK